MLVCRLFQRRWTVFSLAHILQHARPIRSDNGAPHLPVPGCTRAPYKPLDTFLHPTGASKVAGVFISV